MLKGGGVPGKLDVLQQGKILLIPPMINQNITQERPGNCLSFHNSKVMVI